MLAALVDNFEEVLAAAPVPQKKHLLHRLVKKVLIHDRRTVEVWYALPNARRFEDWNRKLRPDHFGEKIFGEEEEGDQSAFQCLSS
jgi:hypothetical protein